MHNRKIVLGFAKHIRENSRAIVPCFLTKLGYFFGLLLTFFSPLRFSARNSPWA